MTRNTRIFGLTLLAGLLASGCSNSDPGGSGDGSEGGDNKDDDSDDDADPAEDDEGEAGDATSGGDSGDDSDPSGGDTEEVPTSDCAAGLPVTSQIPRIKNAQYDAVIRDLFGLTEIDGKAPSDVGPLADDFEGGMTQIAWNGYKATADKIAAAVIAGPRETFISCDPAAAGCLEDTIRAFGRKAFRRPVTDEEVASFMRLTTEVEPPGTPEENAEAILYAFLVSPSFLLIPELSQDHPEYGGFRLSSYEVAARLSFLLWGSVPDDILNAAADADQLQTKEQILEQAQRMVQIREKAGPIVQALHRHYAVVTDGSHFGKRQHPQDPLFTPAVNDVMIRELDAFFEEIAYSGGSFGDLFLSDVAYVNNATAAIYGLDPASYGPELTRVQLDPEQRPGFLTRIAFLSSFAHEDTTSPALRGAYISQHIIGAKVDPPPPGAADATVEGDFETERAYVEALTGQGDCVGCHAPVINPPGFVLENYDYLGAWQDVDPRGGPINATADVAFPGGVKTISSAKQLMDEIANNDGTRAKYAQEVVEFATGRLPNDYDQCIIDDLSVKLASGYTLLDVLVDLSQTDSFHVRKASN